ncbi:hypothetical protein M8J76_006027 [Diaphorina citri]|nr:hypothetical protein M8J76_006027 [Diaphorina citri]
MMEFLNSENYISKIFGGADSETKTSLVEHYAFNEFQIKKLNHANNISESNIEHYERTGVKFLTKEETLYSTILHIITGTESHCNGMTSTTFKSNSPAGMFVKLQTLLTIYPVVKLDNVHRSSNIQKTKGNTIDISVQISDNIFPHRPAQRKEKMDDD